MKIRQNPAPPFPSDLSFPTWEPDVWYQTTVQINTWTMERFELKFGFKSKLTSQHRHNHKTFPYFSLWESPALLLYAITWISAKNAHTHSWLNLTMTELMLALSNSTSFPSSVISLYSMKNHNEMLILRIFPSADCFWTVSWQSCDRHGFYHV